VGDGEAGSEDGVALDAYSHVLPGMQQKAGLPQSTRFHDLRHTAASLLFSQGTHPKLVQEALGHSTIAVTMDVYSHMSPGMGDQVVQAMEDALS
jgi:integrase